MHGESVKGNRCSSIEKAMEMVYDPKGGVDESILASKSYLYF